MHDLSAIKKDSSPLEQVTRIEYIQVSLLVFAHFALISHLFLKSMKHT